MKAKTTKGGVVTATVSGIFDENLSNRQDGSSGSNALPSTSLDESIVSNSSYLLGDTSSSELQQRYLQEKRNSQYELDEFAMIERDLDNIAVTPLLSSMDGGFPVMLQSSTNQTSRSGKDGTQSSGTHTMRATMTSSYGAGRGSDMDDVLSSESDRCIDKSRRGERHNGDSIPVAPSASAYTSLNRPPAPVYSLEDDLESYPPPKDFYAASRAASTPSKAHALQRLHQKIRGGGGGLRASGDSSATGLSVGGSNGSGPQATSRNTYASATSDREDKGSERSGYGRPRVWSEGSGGAWGQGSDGDAVEVEYRDPPIESYDEDGHRGRRKDRSRGGYIPSDDDYDEDGDDDNMYLERNADEASLGGGALKAITELYAIPPGEEEEESEGELGRHLHRPNRPDRDRDYVGGSRRGSWGRDEGSGSESEEEVVDDSKTWRSEKSEGENPPNASYSNGSGGTREQHRYSYSRGSQNEVGAIGGDGADAEWSIRKSGGSLSGRSVGSSRPALRPSSAGTIRSRQSAGSVGQRGHVPTGGRRSNSQDKEQIHPDTASAAAVTGSSLSKKAKELEDEIETYR